MNDQPDGVFVVVDPNFGNRLREIPVGQPVWIADTPVNRAAFVAIGKERNVTNHLIGLTSFVVDANAASEDWLVSEIATIDLHHGEHSRKPPWSMITVIGVRWTKRIQDELERFGFAKHEDTPEGFIAKK